MELFRIILWTFQYSAFNDSSSRLPAKPVSDVATLQAAILHDTLEDTDATAEQISQLFGDQVLSIVLEVPVDKSLPKPERRKAQVERARRMSNAAKQIKVADKISNIGDIDIDGPMSWSTKEKVEYLNFSEQVVLSCNGCNQNLESRFASILDEKRKLFSDSRSACAEAVVGATRR